VSNSSPALLIIKNYKHLDSIMIFHAINNINLKTSLFLFEITVINKILSHSKYNRRKTFFRITLLAKRQLLLPLFDKHSHEKSLIKYLLVIISLLRTYNFLLLMFSFYIHFLRDISHQGFL